MNSLIIYHNYYINYLYKYGFETKFKTIDDME